MPPLRKDHRVHASTMTAMMHKAIRDHLNHPRPDAVLNIESHLYDITLTADRCEYSVDLGKEVWLNKQRWSRLIKEYVAKEHLDRFLLQAREILHGQARDGATANMLFRDPDRYAKKHRWGGCLMGLTFRGSKEDRPTITFYSRTTYIGYMGLLDAGIAACLARVITDGHPEQVGFRWCITSSQLHCFKTLPFIYSQPDLIQSLENYAALIRGQGKACKTEIPPTWYHMGMWYNKVLAAYKEHGTDMLLYEKYGPFKRIKRRWLEYKGYLAKHIPPSVEIGQLGFEKAVMTGEPITFEPGEEGDDE